MSNPGDSNHISPSQIFEDVETAFDTIQNLKSSRYDWAEKHPFLKDYTDSDYQLFLIKLALKFRPAVFLDTPLSTLRIVFLLVNLPNVNTFPLIDKPTHRPTKRTIALNGEFNKELVSAFDFFFFKCDEFFYALPLNPNTRYILSRVRHDIVFSLKRPFIKPPVIKCHEIMAGLIRCADMANVILEKNGFRKVYLSINIGFGYSPHKDTQRTRYGFAKLGLPFVPNFFISGGKPRNSASSSDDKVEDDDDYIKTRFLFYLSPALVF
ncbi:unnamed protein product [Ambrosiozyma monospora]|uniref:Unnamed protein product n=1 Tax=Ambrosiozyma monospora TaxID=43982 RepID=A0ACB5TZ25_AMBMO|nr:unnamed protein product [Ambrosiozyma monospora]